jgi:hypothetical protein
MSRPTSLTELRQLIQDNDRKLLDLCWTRYCETGEPVQARDVHFHFTKRGAEATADRLTGNLVKRGHNSRVPGEVYEILYAGVLASSQGEVLEALFLRFLEAIKSAHRKNHRVTNLSRDELNGYLNATPDELTMLRRFLDLGIRAFGVYIGGTNQDGGWSVSIADDVADLQEVDDLREWLQRYAVKGYDEGMPVPELERSNWALRKEGSAFDKEDLFSPSAQHRAITTDPPDLSAIKDERLRFICSQTWKDALVAHHHGLIRPAMVLVGSTAEGLLLDRLQQEDADAVRAASRSCNVSRAVSEMGLDEMVRIAEKVGVIRPTSKHLAHFLREHRNAIHPARQVRDPVQLTTQDVEIAFLVLQALLRELSARREA